MVEVFVAEQDREQIEELFTDNGGRQLIFCENLHSNVRLCAATFKFECGPIDFQCPANPEVPGQIFGDMIFPDVAIQRIGRPIRMIIMNNNELPPTVWELGGYELTTT
jgi:hypothetical protein